MMDVTSIAVTAQSPPQHGGDLRILIAPRGEFLAEASIENGALLSLEDQDSASMLVKMVLEPAIQNWQRKNEDTSLFSMNPRQFENVVPLWNDQVEVETEWWRTKALSTNLMFLHGKNSSAFDRVTSEIHEVSQRWASLRFSDIKSQVASAQDLHDLGTVTLVVHDLNSLSIQEQNILGDFIEDARISEDPLLLITSTMSVQEIAAKPSISPRFANLMQNSVVEVDRLPVAPQLLRETLELFLEPEAMI